MKFFKRLSKLLQRIRNPVSMPEDIGKDLGIQILYNELSFEECIDKLVSSEMHSKYLNRFMPRKEAELLFKSALRKETFNETSLFSYYIYDGWLAFKLIFDTQNKLRRVYVQHRALKYQDSEDGIEMSL